MGQEEFESMLRESAFFRHTMAGLLQSAEQAMAILTTAVARQIDAPNLDRICSICSGRRPSRSPIRRGTTS
jgi:hypothetical protein